MDYANAQTILSIRDEVVKFRLRGYELTAIRGISMAGSTAVRSCTKAATLPI